MVESKAVMAEIEKAFKWSVTGRASAVSQYGKAYVVQAIYIPGNEGLTAEQAAHALLRAMPIGESGSYVDRQNEVIVWRRPPEIEWRAATQADEFGPGSLAGWYGSMRYHLMPNAEVGA